MGANERIGARKDRIKKQSLRKPELGYYLIVTDTEETERNYFEGLRDSIPADLKGRLVIKVHEVRTIDLVERCRELRDQDPQYRIPWIIFDKDQTDFDKIIDKANRRDINVGWSNPCIEIWFMSYFGEMPTITDSTNCCKNFKDKLNYLSNIEYKKSDKEIYKYLNKYGNEELAIKIAEDKYNQFINDCITNPSDMCPSSTIYKLIRDIKLKIAE